MGVKYYGNKEILDSMIFLKEVIEACNCETSEINITIPLSGYIMELCVKFLHTGFLDINKISKDHIIQFLQFIDAYKTIGLNSQILEEDLMDYFANHQIESNIFLIHIDLGV